MAERLYALFYDYVEGIAEKRGPFREEHLALIARWHDEGRIEIAGAVGDPPHAGLFAFRVDDPSDLQAFMDEDPYVANGLVAGHRVEPWTVVT